MNGHFPSGPRISWTTLGLNYMLRIQQSVRNLANRLSEGKQHYQKSTLADSQILADFITKKFANFETERKKSCKFNPTFFYTKKTNFTCDKMSEQLNDAFEEVGTYADRYLDTILSQHDQFLLDNDVTEEEDDNDNEIDNDY